MKLLRTIRNYFFYCGIEKDEYNELKKEAYISNFKLWRVLHYLMAAAFGILFFSSLISEMMQINRIFYLIGLVYSVIAIVLFHIIKKDSILAQFMIYFSISMLFIFGCFLTRTSPNEPAVFFIVLLLISAMFMIDKPYFMAIELCAASSVFLIWMYNVKPYEVWRMDCVNVIIYTILGIFLNIIENSIRIKEFILSKKLRIQKDTDELTGINNKSGLTRKINKFIENGQSDKGILFLMDVDKFKSINDTHGHDSGDSVIEQLGKFLGSKFSKDEIVGRFGGDEFVVFFKNTDDLNEACRIANEIITGAAENVEHPAKDQKVSVSVGIAIYTGQERDYKEVFKKADIALYRSKADPDKRYCVYE